MKVKKIDIEDEFYPRNLRNIKNPPKKLYVLGDETILNNESLSVIGSRKCTEYGADITTKFSKEIAKRGIVIVSGMAKGIDSFAHLGAIEAGGKTIAVLGSGFNHIFPDRYIFDRILESGGTVITEYSEDVDVFPQGFRDRNRIVASLASGVFVVEAKYKSGTSITASYAKRYGKKIFCIPHTIEDESGIGTNRLLKNGALLVTEPQDILQHFKHLEQIEREKNTLIVEIPEEYRSVYEQIKNQELNANEISKKVKKNISEVNTILTMLELEGHIICLPGSYFKAKVN